MALWQGLKVIVAKNRNQLFVHQNPQEIVVIKIKLSCRKTHLTTLKA